MGQFHSPKMFFCQAPAQPQIIHAAEMQVAIKIDIQVCNHIPINDLQPMAKDTMSVSGVADAVNPSQPLRITSESTLVKSPSAAQSLAVTRHLSKEVNSTNT
jgi:hypothetical protein